MSLQAVDQLPSNASKTSNQITGSGLAELAFMHTTNNGMVSGMYTSKTMKVELDLKEMVFALNDQVRHVQRGNLKNANLDRSYLDGIGRGEHNLIIMNLAKIAKALDISPSELLAKAKL